MYLNTFIELQENISGYGRNSKKPSGHTMITMPGMIRVYAQDLRDLSEKQYICYALSKKDNRAIRVGAINTPSESKMTNFKVDINNVQGKGVRADNIDCIAIIVEGDKVGNTDTIMVGYVGEKYLITPMLEKALPRKEVNLSDDERKDKTPTAPPKTIKVEKKIEPKSEPKVEVKVEKKVEPKAEPKVEVKVEKKVEPKAEPKVEVKVEPKPEPKVEVKVEKKVEPKPEPKVEVKVEPKPEPKVEVKVEKPVESKLVEPKVEKKVEPKPEHKIEVKVEPKLEVIIEPKLEVIEKKVEIKVEKKVESKSEVKVEVKPEQKVEKKEECKSEVKKKVEKEVSSEILAELKAKMKSQYKPEIKVEKKPETKVEEKKEECKWKIKKECEECKHKKYIEKECEHRKHKHKYGCNKHGYNKIKDIMEILEKESNVNTNISENLESELKGLINQGISKEEILNKKDELKRSIQDLVDNKLNSIDVDEAKNLEIKLKSILNEKLNTQYDINRECKTCKNPVEKVEIIEEQVEDGSSKEEVDFLQRLENKLKGLQSLLKATVDDEIEEVQGVQDNIREKTVPLSSSARREEYQRVRGIFETSVSIKPFDNQYPSVDWVRISLAELISIPQLSYEWATQPFITFSYHKFNHLILGKDKEIDQYYIGIPDVYNQTRGYILNLDKIERFVCRSAEKLVIGEPGYWIAMI